MRKRVVIPAVLFVAVIAVSVGLYLFQPWRIFTSSPVVEDVPAVCHACRRVAGVFGSALRRRRSA